MATDEDDPGAVVGRIMDKAAGADREALFAALQAAMGIGIAPLDGSTGRPLRSRLDDLLEVERRLDIGHPYGWEFQPGNISR